MHAVWVFSQEEVKLLREARSEAREIGKGDLKSDPEFGCKLDWVPWWGEGKGTGYRSSLEHPGELQGCGAHPRF